MNPDYVFPFTPEDYLRRNQTVAISALQVTQDNAHLKGLLQKVILAAFIHGKFNSVKEFKNCPEFCKNISVNELAFFNESLKAIAQHIKTSNVNAVKNKVKATLTPEEISILGW